MNQIRPRRLTRYEIRECAEEFRQKHVKPIDKVPVPIEEIVEFDLNILPIPIPGLLKEVDVDGFLSSNLHYIYIDNDLYNDSKYENRIRFTLAHEVGHFVLHKKEIQQCSFRNADEWINFREDMSEDDLFWFEQQAYEFAGRLLVPKNKLITELKNNKNKIEQFRELAEQESEELLTHAISRVICDKFNVSDQVIYRRIKNENLWNATFL